MDLSWFKLYLSSRTFRVKCDTYFSSSGACLCGVPQGSVFGPLLFIMYTSPLSTLISSLSLNHHLYAMLTTHNFSCIFVHLTFDSSAKCSATHSSKISNRLQVIQNSLAQAVDKAPNSVTSPLFSNLYTGLKSMNALNINFFLLPIKLLSLLNLLICIA